MMMGQQSHLVVNDTCRRNRFDRIERAVRHLFIAGLCHYECILFGENEMLLTSDCNCHLWTCHYVGLKENGTNLMSIALFCTMEGMSILETRSKAGKGCRMPRINQSSMAETGKIVL